MSLSLVTAPAVEPVTLADAKLQLGLSPYEDTDHIRSEQLAAKLRRYITAARAMCEDYTRRALITQVWVQRMDGWRNPILLPKPPFQGIVGFTYVDTSGATQDASVYTYQLDHGSETQPARIAPPWATPWPPLRLVQNSVAITFRCGYGDTGASVPPQITQAILFLVEWMYNTGGSVDTAMPRIVTSLLDPYRNLVS